MSNDLIRPMPRPPAQVEPYVRALGPDLAVQFLLTYGGAELTLSGRPGGRSGHERMLGHDAAKRLAEHAGAVRRIPLAKRWLAKMLHWQSMSNAAIARRLRITDLTVRRYLKDDTVR